MGVHIRCSFFKGRFNSFVEDSTNTFSPRTSQYRMKIVVRAIKFHEGSEQKLSLQQNVQEKIFRWKEHFFPAKTFPLSHYSILAKISQAEMGKPRRDEPKFIVRSVQKCDKVIDRILIYFFSTMEFLVFLLILHCSL